MVLQLNSRQQSIVTRLLETGRYADASEVIDQALELFEARDAAVEQLRAELQDAADQLDRGEGVDFSPRWFASRVALARARVTNGAQPDCDAWP